MAFLAKRVRPSGAPRWDEPGIVKAIRDKCADWKLDMAIQHVMAHARDPKAKTPFAIRGPAPHLEPEKPTNRPPKADEACRTCGGWRNNCACSAVGKIPAFHDDWQPEAMSIEQAKQAARAAIGKG